MNERTEPVYKQIAQNLRALETSKMHPALLFTDRIHQIIKEYLPSGSGFDGGVEFLEKSTSNKIYLKSAFHCMDDNGYYDGWLPFTITVTPDLSFDFNLKINWHGYSKNKYKFILEDHVYETFHTALSNEQPII